MRMYDLIIKKKQGAPLSAEEIRFMIDGYTKGEIPDYQMSAMMMAICFRGMNEEETFELTHAMAESGDMLDLSAIRGIKVDKHSTGGVGDKTSLALTPIVASCGVKIAKMSGRGLGHTGGTIDKLESITGFHTDISTDTFIRNVNEIGIAIMGQTKDLAPADKKLYALRDVTGTVDQMSLIASSIMSKKLAAGADAIVLDVKTGSGAFMKKKEDSFALAREMVAIGKSAGRKMTAVISNMDEPLGRKVGNAMEVEEAIDTLMGKGPEDFTELVETLGAYMLKAGGITPDADEAVKMIREAVSSGKALDKFAEFVKAQGGNEKEVYDPSLLPKSRIVRELKSEEAGYIGKIECEEVGISAMILGGGRKVSTDTIDPSVGIELLKKCGDRVEKGEPYAVIHANDEGKLEECVKRLAASYTFTDRKPEKLPTITGVIE
ncbi:MAG: pyrimidine-nucleoside phosphorylase [Lachnospiraceae bacterium]|nr:pyrimidine-nucleoside phosphorylase [Lachnospiraceae bacterium]